jgi:hypothetical protein
MVFAMTVTAIPPFAGPKLGSTWEIVWNESATNNLIPLFVKIGWVSLLTSTLAFPGSAGPTIQLTAVEDTGVA